MPSVTSTILFVLLLASGTVPASTLDSLHLMVNFFNILYTDRSLDFNYDFGKQSNVLKGEGLVSVWGPMELKESSYIAQVDNYTKLVSIELHNKEHILVNANTYNDLKLEGCQIRLEIAVEKMSGTSIRPLSVIVEDCKKIYYTASNIVPEAKDVLPEVSSALLFEAKSFLDFFFSDRPRLGSVSLDAQQQLFAAFLYYS